MDVTDWLRWFLGTLGRAMASAQTTLDAVLHRARMWQRWAELPLNERQVKVLNRLLDGFDGLELLPCETDGRGVVPKERVAGVHMSYFPYWLDFWRGDEQALLGEFGTLDACERYYGGTTREALLAIAAARCGECGHDEGRDQPVSSQERRGRRSVHG